MPGHYPHAKMPEVTETLVLSFLLTLKEAKDKKEDFCRLMADLSAPRFTNLNSEFIFGVSRSAVYELSGEELI
jgi:hypothetical protein